MTSSQRSALEKDVKEQGEELLCVHEGNSAKDKGQFEKKSKGIWKSSKAVSWQWRKAVENLKAKK